ncbi:MAG: HAD family phosphatase [Acidaminococcaceae bacterium]|nr:HAD family phosphatase [Acidaminococcaceae bacterium]
MTVFCDLDGTLIDSSARHAALLRALLSEDFPEVPFTLEDYLAQKAEGLSTRDYLLKKGLDRVEAQRISGGWVQHIEDRAYLESNTIYPDALAFLELQRVAGRRIIFVSARRNGDALMDTLRRLSIISFAERVLIVPPIHAAQGKAEGILRFARAGDCLVGDTEADMDCAAAVGIRGFALNRGFRSRAYWDRRGLESYPNLMVVRDKIEEWKRNE